MESTITNFENDIPFISLDDFDNSFEPPENYFANNWAKLKQFIEQVYSVNVFVSEAETSFKPFIEKGLFVDDQLIINLCRLGFGPVLYTNISKLIETRLSSSSHILHSLGHKGVEYLDLVHREWRNFYTCTRYIKEMFTYLNATYVAYNFDCNNNDIVKHAVFKFRDQFCINEEGLQNFYKALCGQINIEKKNISYTNRTKDLIEMIYKLDLFRDKTNGFQTMFIFQTKTYYQSVAIEFIQKSKANIVHHIEQLELNNKLESQRNIGVFDNLTCASIAEALNNQLIVALFEKGNFKKEFSLFIEEGNTEILKKIYKLSKTIKRADAVSEAFQNNIQEQVSNLISTFSKKEYIIFIDKLIVLHTNYQNILLSIFENDELIKNAMKNKFETLLNASCIYFSGALVKFIDELLRNPKEEIGEFNIQIESVLHLFRYISGKDVFETKYKQAMVNRLLFHKKQNLDREKNLINRLKDVCGRSFTYKLDGMINDIIVSKDLSDLYNNADIKKPTFKFNPLILTKGFWPKLPRTEISIPEDMKQQYQEFKSHYLKSFKSRRLEQYNALDTLNIKCHYKNKTTKQFEVTLYQALVLLCFQDHDLLTLNDIYHITKIDQKLLKKELLILSNEKCQVLKIKAQANSLEPVYEFNENFQFPHSRVVFTKSQLVNKKDKELEKEDHTGEFKNRALENVHYMELAIMRILKQQKKATLPELVEFSIKETKLNITIAEVKERIDQLMERDFIRVNEENPTIYEYVA